MSSDLDLEALEAALLIEVAEKQKRIQIQLQLQKSLKSCDTLLTLANEIIALSTEIHQMTIQFLRKRTRYMDLALQISEHLFSDQLTSFIPLYLAMSDMYTTVQTRVENFDSRLAQVEQRKRELLEEIGLPIRMCDIKTIEQDSEAVMKTLEEGIKKALEVKTNFESSKAEWNTMKHRLDTDLENCMQQANSLHQVTQQGQIANEE